jgi:SAM-dependent methyltransferase
VSNWAEGYVADVEYLPSINREQAAAHMALAALVCGHEPPPLEAGYSYCELGCGHGLTLNLLAAADPGGRFVGIDFNPVHTLQAREFAAKAQLDNISFHEAGFEELLRDGAPYLEPFDVVAAHGVYSWVSEENRRHIVALLRRYVKPGGMVYLSYNAMPGWAVALPLQRLFLDLASLDPGRSDHKIEAAIKFAVELQQVGGLRADSHVFLEDIGERLTHGDVRYLAHEYLNQYWSALYFADVARELAEAKLDFAASTALLENFPDLQLSAGQRALLAKAPTSLRETIGDYCRLQKFRRDLYIRGRRSVSERQRDERLRQVRLVLAVARADVSIKMKLPVGEVELAAKTYEPVFDALAEGPRTIGELLDLPALRAANSMVQPVELAGFLVGSGLAALCRKTPTDAARIKRLNAAMAELVLRDRNPRVGALAAPILDSGIAQSPLDLVLYSELADMPRARGAEAVADRILARLEAAGSNVLREGKPISDDPAQRSQFVQQIATLTEKRVPLWQRLGIL